MRLHDLSVTAFGPFVETVHVDFDDLSAGGLFLLTGDTGAGKSSVLDAVCFGLYGEVPGDRHTARHLRSDNADPGAEPQVVLRVSIRGRMFRFTRSPAWDRPKRRGTGTTRVQAHVVVEERRGEEWIGLTNRLDETGHLVTELLGMTCTQFTQVAMLPQGRFQTFLRASSAERHAVLQRLFRTRRFEDVERWLVERRLELGRACRDHHDRAAGVVSRVQEAADARLPEHWDEQDLDPVAADGSLERWTASLLTGASSELDRAAAAMTAATTAVTRDQDALDRARSLAEARSRGASARARLVVLDEAHAAHEALVAALDAHRRAAPVLPQAVRVETAQTQHAEAEARATRQLERVRDLVGSAPDLDALMAAVTRTGEERAVAESWLPREQELTDQRARLDELADACAELTRQVAEGDARSTELAKIRVAVGRELARAVEVAARCAADVAAVEAAEQGLEAAAEAARLGTELAAARSRLAQATAHAQDLRQAYLDLRERRINGMAAELAGGLAVGCSCPVCGSVEHPAPASDSAAVSSDDEDAAQTRHENADFERQTVQELVTTLSTRLQAALVRSGGHTVTHWRAIGTTATTRAAESAAAEQEATRLRTESAELEQEEREVTTRVATARVSLVERTREHAETSVRQERLAADLRTLLAGHSTTTVAALVDSHRRALADLQEARSALATWDRAAHELDQATSTAEATAAEAGFESLRHALAAVLPGGQAGTGAREVEEHRTARAAAEAVLAEEPVRDALSADEPDMPVLVTRLAESTRLRDDAHAAHEQARRRVERLGVLVDELAEVLSRWAPTRQDHDLVAGLAALVEGKSTDNQLKMRLSAYVLSERLRQVVEAANERLGAMTDQRYTLEQADERGAGEQRGGLSLRVRDEWSGKQRDPATLSGGETFIVSLALALGLADTVSHEAGGTQLDTLFIDEGFGALDATTLDGVMDTLDALRDGGRVVGLVSHVAELRNRVPAQLEVRKARRGSTLSSAVVGG